ncbi:MAG: hypothetical protein A3I04_00735 [Nitrospinae bacterium RIFCSPLOWO2_02_FULL_39_110]|nr:MAG: hypothetical protein A2W53_07855 [Nitrospinae bacterium RIFCSPHIGHO2_02_39_11]OGW00832.1 MAG: hypothetical protein A3D97_01345 [Nitrospinae bacterium RIFCSPHIGHO2_12_FULL_39_42]OGW02415.1 MAG: hypothetical protein A3D20_07645 [Nitrospinae bacterium RIFCSPHIGHO2_02_FULL_39_82]OGW03450.1 MAG: hypothetical protein A3I04_00735 [Nitrospinae bacterium RIFCSPLOWO2_02_FULL_39_110]OGW04961.1 MAG: hypothetical protein A2Z59_06580 [Nitrospinae bacterium RIFCSPLOWO2_02_39_17]OGW08041.1 MAG: hypoth
MIQFTEKQMCFWVYIKRLINCMIGFFFKQEGKNCIKQYILVNSVFKNVIYKRQNTTGNIYRHIMHCESNKNLSVETICFSVREFPDSTSFLLS